MNLVQIVGLLLAISIAGNAWQWHAHDKAVFAEASAKQLAADTRASAEACSSSVKELKLAGERRDESLAAAMSAIAPAVARQQKAALEVLAAKPRNSADLCGSLLEYLRGQIKIERGVPQ